MAENEKTINAIKDFFKELENQDKDYKIYKKYHYPEGFTIVDNRLLQPLKKLIE